MSYNDFDSEFYESGWPRRVFGSWQSNSDDGLPIGIGLSPSFGSRYTRIGDVRGSDLYDSYQSFSNNNPICRNWSSVYSSSNKEYIRNMKDKDMNFVGVNVFSDGIVAFGDSKSTKIDELENHYEDVDRNVKKLIHTNGRPHLQGNVSDGYIHSIREWLDFSIVQPDDTITNALLYTPVDRFSIQVDSYYFENLMRFDNWRKNQSLLDIAEECMGD